MCLWELKGHRLSAIKGKTTPLFYFDVRNHSYIQGVSRERCACSYKAEPAFTVQYLSLLYWFVYLEVGEEIFHSEIH